MGANLLRLIPAKEKGMVTSKRLIFLGLSVLILTACHIASRQPPLPPASTLPPTPIPTLVFSTPTISPMAVPTSYLEDVHVVSVDTFDNPSGWNPTQEILNGELLLIGSGDNNWHGLSNRAIFREGSGAMINFQFTSGEYFEMYFENGPWTTSLYKRFGVYVNEDHSNVNLFTGRQRRSPSPIEGSLSFRPDTWYSLLLAIGKGGDFLAVIWDPANPGNSLQYREVIGNWKGLEWAFRIQVNQGSIAFDNFEQIVFDSLR